MTLFLTLPAPAAIASRGFSAYYPFFYSILTTNVRKNLERNRLLGVCFLEQNELIMQYLHQHPTSFHVTTRYNLAAALENKCLHLLLILHSLINQIQMTKYFILIFGLSFILTGCVSDETVGSITNTKIAIEEASKKTNYVLTYEMLLTEAESNPLSIRLNAPISKRATSGLILLECFISTSKYDLNYDRFLLKDENGRLIADMNYEDLESIRTFQDISETAMAFMDKGDKENLKKYLNMSVFENVDYPAFFEQFRLMKNNNNAFFEGFELIEDKGIQYCQLIYSFNNNLLGVIFNFNDNNKNIWGIVI